MDKAFMSSTFLVIFQLLNPTHMRKTGIFLFVSLLSFLPLFGQNTDQKADSLLNLYYNTNETEMQIDLLDELMELYFFQDIEIAKSYLDTLLTKAHKSNYKKGISKGTANLGYYYYTIEKMDSAHFYLNKAKKYAIENKETSVLPEILSNLSLVQGHKGEYLQAVKLMDSVAELYKQRKDYLNYGVSVNNSAAHYYDMGNYLEAMKGYRKALAIIDTIDREPYRKADILRNIGKLNTRQGNLSEALDYFEQALTTYLAIDDYTYASSTYTDMGSVYSDLENQEKALEHYLKALEIGKLTKNESITNIAKGNIAIAYKDTEQFDKAIAEFQEILSTPTQDASDINRIIYLYHLGDTHRQIGNQEQALTNLNKAIGMAEKGNIENELQNALDFRAKAFETFGAPQLAITDLRRAQELKDSIFTKEQAKQINYLRTSFEADKKEAALALQEEEIAVLNERAKVDKLTRSLYAGGMVAFIVISGLLYFGFRQRIKKNRIARKKQEAIYQQEIEHKQKELASQTLHLVQKNTFIQELMQNLENVKNSPDKFKTEFRRMVMLLKKENASDKDWEVFKTYFSEVHNDFDQKLKTIYAEISEKEIRLAAFLRMNLTTKEIAATLNVLPDSILKSKYRLKKKLGLEKETDLNQFLNAL